MYPFLAGSGQAPLHVINFLILNFFSQENQRARGQNEVEDKTSKNALLNNKKRFFHAMVGKTKGVSGMLSNNTDFYGMLSNNTDFYGMLSKNTVFMACLATTLIFMPCLATTKIFMAC
jgi:hypothetical protein